MLETDGGDAADVFGTGYAASYDALYAEKNYAAECDIIERAFERFSSSRVRTVLDLGCGTGGHSVPLASRGYEVTGVDLSSPMLEIAKAKAGNDRLDVSFLHGDVRSVEVGRQFDAVLLMFAVLGYQRTNADVAATLENVRRHLRPDGLLVFDFWYGPAVLVVSPSDRERVVEAPAGPIVRSATAELDVLRHVCTVTYQLTETMANGRTRSTTESHVMRYFFPLELERYLECAKLELVSLTSTGTLDREPASDTWNVLGVARAM